MKPLVQNATIEYFTKNVYGLEKMYVKDTDTAAVLSALTGKITVDEADMKNLTTLFGIVWNEVIAPKK